MTVRAPDGAVAITNVIFVAFEASWVQPPFNALIAASALPVSLGVVVVALAFVPVLDGWVSVDAVDLAVPRGPSNPVLFALAAPV